MSSDGACRWSREAVVTGPGIAVLSTLPSVRPRLRMAFDESPDREGLFAAPVDRLDELRDVLSLLSVFERQTTRACVIANDGSFDPWRAGPVERGIRQIETPWFSDALLPQNIAFHYQPIVDARTFEVIGNEALARARVDGWGIGPELLVDAAHAHDELLALDEALRREAIIKSAEYLRSGLKLFINFFPMTVYDPATCLQSTFSAANSLGVPFDRFVFEVIESETYPDAEQLRRIVEAYRSRGAGVALGDLSSGSASLLSDERFVPDYVKLDRDLLRRAVEGGRPGLYAGVARLAQDRGVAVVAEGFETKAEFEFCLELGVEYAQGYYFRRPMSEPAVGSLAGRSAA
ncbi:MAG: hypothetical protein CMJ31_13055 [Phycisphaerae bacterium]|nr:hypothetical protein [Phycisphaerae bacterium]